MLVCLIVSSVIFAFLMMSGIVTAMRGDDTQAFIPFCVLFLFLGIFFGLKTAEAYTDVRVARGIISDSRYYDRIQLSKNNAEIMRIKSCSFYYIGLGADNLEPMELPDEDDVNR